MQHGTTTWPRRAVLAGMLAGVACAGAARARADVQPQPPEEHLLFDIFAGDRHVGTHAVTFAPHPEGGFEARTLIDVRVSLAFLTLYRYRHEVREWWREGLVRAFRVRAEDGDERREIVGEPAGPGLRVRTPHGVREVPLGVMTDIAFWNPAIVRQHRLLDTWDGDLVGVRGRGGVVERVALGDREVEAVRYDLSAESGREATVWYDRQGRWIRGRVKIGRVELAYLRAA